MKHLGSLYEYFRVYLHKTLDGFGLFYSPPLGFLKLRGTLLEKKNLKSPMSATNGFFLSICGKMNYIQDENIKIITKTFFLKTSNI